MTGTQGQGVARSGHSEASAARASPVSRCVVHSFIGMAPNPR